MIRFFPKNILFPVALTLLTAFSTMGDAGYRIAVNIAGLQDTTTYLAYHFGERQFLKDTAQVDHHGNFVFEGEEPLLPGMYLIVLPGNSYFEVIVDNTRHFNVFSSSDNLVESLRFENSPENTQFYEYLGLLKEINQKLSELRKQLESDNLTPAETEKLTDRLVTAENELLELQNSFIDKNPGSLFSKILLAQQSPDLSDIPAGIKNDPAHADLVYHTYKERFWDKIDFSDDRILRTPLFHSMLVRYFNNFLIQVPDTIVFYADQLLEKSRDNQEVFRYTLWFVANNFERSQIMGMDAVFVHVIDNYYSKGEAFWMTEDGLKRIMNRANQLRPLLLGRIAPDITGFGPGGQRISLHDIQSKYLVVYFWESECGHCQRETPALDKLYIKYKDQGLEVFALNVETDPEAWKQAVDKYGLSWINANDPLNSSGYREKYDVYAIPLIYLLDSEKRIIAKKISADQLQGFLQFQAERE